MFVISQCCAHQLHSSDQDSPGAASDRGRSVTLAAAVRSPFDYEVPSEIGGRLWRRTSGGPRLKLRCAAVAVDEDACANLCPRDYCDCANWGARL